MQRKYGIGFLAGVFLISWLYCATDVWLLKKEQEKAYPYYLYEKDEKVNVYEGDRLTLYEETSIAVETLPEKLQEEIRGGKPVENLEELYSFLENYSS